MSKYLHFRTCVDPVFSVYLPKKPGRCVCAFHQEQFYQQERELVWTEYLGGGCYAEITTKKNNALEHARREVLR